MKRAHLMKIAAVAAGLLATSARARDVQNFKPTVGDWNLFSVQTALTAPEGFIAPSLVVSYGRDPVMQQAPNGLVLSSVVEHLATAHVMAAYGLTDRLDVALELPLGFTHGEGLDGLSGGGAPGDVRLSGKYRLLGQRRHGLALSLDLTAPTGEADRGMSADTFVALPRLVGHTRAGPVMLAANVGYRHRVEETQLSNLSFGDEITWGAGASRSPRASAEA